jgi:hypothetical protein
VDVLFVAALDLREGLGDRVEMVEGELAFPADQGAPILPA